jgi:hypothetical protein
MDLNVNKTIFLKNAKIVPQTKSRPYNSTVQLTRNKSGVRLETGLTGQWPILVDKTMNATKGSDFLNQPSGSELVKGYCTNSLVYTKDPH